MTEQMVCMLVFFLCEWRRAFPQSQRQGKVLLKNELHAHIFNLCVPLHTEYRESYVPLRKEMHQQRLCFQASVYQELSKF